MKRQTGVNADSCVKVLAFLQTRLVATGEYPCTLQDAADEAVMSLRTFTWAVDQLVAAGLVTSESLGRFGTIFRAGSVSPVACAIDQSGNVSIAEMAKSGNDAPLPIHGGLEADVPLKETQPSTAAAAAVPEGDHPASLVAGLNPPIGRETTGSETKAPQECEATAFVGTFNRGSSEGEASRLFATSLDRFTTTLDARLGSLQATVASLVDALKAESTRSPSPAAAAFYKKGNAKAPQSDYGRDSASLAPSAERVRRAVGERIRQMKADGRAIPAPAGLRRTLKEDLTRDSYECDNLIRDEEEWLAAEKKRTEEEAAFAASPEGIWRALPPEEKRRRAYALADEREAEGIARAKILNARDAIWASKTPEEKEAAIVACIESGSQRGTPAMRRFRAAQVALEVIEAQVIARLCERTR